MIEPICLRLRNQDVMLAQITAASAVLKLKNREIQFRGKVRLSSSPKILEAGEMSFHPEKGKIRVGGDYVLQSPSGRITGRRLETDVLLKETGPGS